MRRLHHIQRSEQERMLMWVSISVSTCTTHRALVEVRCMLRIARQLQTCLASAYVEPELWVNGHHAA